MWLTNTDTLPGTNIRVRLLFAFIMTLMFHPFCYFKALSKMLTRPGTFLAFSLLLYISISYVLFSTNQNSILRNELTLLFLMVWTFLLVRRPNDLEKLINVLLIISTMIAGTMLYYGLFLHDIGRLVFSDRMNPNIQAYVLAFAFPLAFHKLQQKSPQSTAKQYGYLLIIFMLLTAVIGTGSRGGFLVAIGLSVWGVFSLFAFQQVNRKQILLLLLGIISVAGLSLSISNNGFLSGPLNRIAGLQVVTSSNIEQLDTMQTRVPAQRAAFETWKNNPIYGVGYGVFSYRTSHASINSHNTYLEVLAELGLIGFAIYGCLLLYIANRMYRLLGYPGFGIGLFFIIAPLGSNIFLTFHLFYIIAVLTSITFSLRKIQ